MQYPYVVYTHCGVRFAYLDGRWWKADPALTDTGDERGANPPHGWGNPSDRGYIVLLSEQRARYTSENGAVAEFQALSAEVQENPGPPCY